MEVRAAYMVLQATLHDCSARYNCSCLLGAFKKVETGPLDGCDLDETGKLRCGMIWSEAGQDLGTVELMYPACMHQ